ncbi:YifB family Mg chelatase-like AAA ATPase [Hespellia stercorisuis]|uniref:YifB family Mg chelatase-like AAA ATPase n=1 Tax=Hespellia stercorisuis TaxID=180311 RepID=UPI0009337286|nr:YifB family Mg chelatase-like AAA ATPase [Hespellia stercorisuis]
MFSTVLSATIDGLCVEMVRVEVDVSNGLPMLHMVGFLSSEVKEAGDRVKTAIANTGIHIPPKKIVINLSPATVKKRGASFDLPIALGILAAFECINSEPLRNALVIGELSLDGMMRSVTGVLPIVAEAKKLGCCTCIVPEANVEEASVIEGMCVVGVSWLQDVLDYTFDAKKFLKKNHREDRERVAGKSCRRTEAPDFQDVAGQETLKRAVEVAVAGQHNLLMIGTPGASKTMIAKRIPSILPPLSKEESIEISKIYSIMGMLSEVNPLVTERPFREVHHTATKTALVGGGTIPMPGEISLAHGGVLMMDELAEFQKQVLEVLRQPLEEQQIQIVRARGSYLFPADFLLVAALNPCPCGYYPDANRCTCSPGEINRYLGKISQPFLSRMDICVEASRVEYEELNAGKKGEPSEKIRERVCAARKRQALRYRDLPVQTNGRLTVHEIEKYCELDREGARLMKQAYDKMGLTARTYHKILKVARTIADLNGADQISASHVAEALGYRAIDKKYWGRYDDV